MSANQRAASIGLGAGFSIGLTAIWSGLLAANLGSTPRAPWSALAMVLALAGAWRVLAAKRSELLPRRCHSRAHRRWAFIAALALMSAAFCATLLAIQIAQTPVAVLPAAASASPLLACIYFATASLVAAVAEETGFRGVMQHGLERSAPPWVASVVVASTFWMLHAGSPEFIAFAPIYLVSSLGLSLIVRASASLWPGIAGLALADFASYALLLDVGVDAIRALGLQAQAITALVGAVLLALAWLAMSRLQPLPRL